MMSVAVPIEPIAVPLVPHANGTLFVRDSGIPLERLIDSYNAGSTPADIVDMFDTLRLADVFAVISYYLDHLDEVDAYLGVREEEADRIQAMIEAAQPPRTALQEELQRRWAAHPRNPKNQSS
jgi:uncharacterized protein (DUF433 family)